MPDRIHIKMLYFILRCGMEAAPYGLRITVFVYILVHINSPRYKVGFSSPPKTSPRHTRLSGVHTSAVRYYPRGAGK